MTRVRTYVDAINTTLYLVWLVKLAHDNVKLSLVAVRLEELWRLIVKGREKKDALKNRDADGNGENYSPVIVTNKAIFVINMPQISPFTIAKKIGRLLGYFCIAVRERDS